MNFAHTYLMLLTFQYIYMSCRRIAYLSGSHAWMRMHEICVKMMHTGGGVVPRSNTNELLNGPDLATIKCKNRNYDHQLQLDKYHNSIMSIL